MDEGLRREAAGMLTSESLAHIQGFDVFENENDFDDILEMGVDDDEDNRDNDSEASDESSSSEEY